MDEKTKNVIVYGVMGIIITLFLISIFIGEAMMQGKSKGNPKDSDMSAHGDKPIHAYKSQTKTVEKKTKEPNVIQEDHKQKEVKTPNPATLKEPKSFYSKYFTNKQIKQSKKTAKQFATNYYAFDGDNPIRHIENASDYMTDKMYLKLIENTPRPTATIYKKKINSVEVYEPYEPSKEYFVWKVRITGDIYNSKGNQTKQEIVDYTLKMKQTEETFMVKNYMLNVLNH